MNYTEKFGLAKPESTDLFRTVLPDAMGQNMDIIDESMSGLSDRIQESESAIDDNFAEIQDLKSNKANQSVVSSLQSTVSALGTTKADKTTVNALSQNVTLLQNDSNSCKQALFGSDKITKLDKISQSDVGYNVASDGTLEFTNTKRTYIFNVSDCDKIIVNNSISSYVAFYNTATPISNNQISSESVVSVSSFVANTPTEYAVPNNAVTFGITEVNGITDVYGIGVNKLDGIADFDYMTENLYNPDLTEVVSGNLIKTNCIPVKPNTTYIVSKDGKILAQIYPHSTYKGQFIDENLNIISAIETNPFTTPENCKYIYLTLDNAWTEYKLEEGSTFTAYIPYGFKQSYPEYYTSPFRNKKYCAVGDSITEGSSQNPSYAGKLSKKLAMIRLFDSNAKTAISGSTVSAIGTRIDYMCSDGRIANIPQDSDIITIMGGTNDTASGDFVLGTLDGEHVETTFYGAYQLMLDKIYARCPNADIFLCEMPYAYIASSAQRTRAEQGQQAIRDIAEKYRLPLLKSTADGVNEVNYTTYRADVTHPNQAGHERLASLLSAQMKAYRG